MIEREKKGEEEDPAEPGGSVSEPEAPAEAEEPSDVEGLRARLEEEKGKAEGYLANWQRAAADYQNFKRRVEQERQETARLANAALIINVLPLVDDLERALTTVDARLAGLTWVDGIRLIYRKFQAVLEAAGVSEIKAEGETFDPAVHEAVMFGEGEEGKVVSQVQKGYMLGDRVIRPAMVVVGQAKKEAGEREEEAPEEGDDGAESEESSTSD
jgi:molecular chaperone GrpE